MLKICIDPGHGGAEPGACYFGYQEKNLNLAIATFLDIELKTKGFLTKLTRTSDSFVSLSQRAHISNQFQAHYFLSIHCNAFGSSIPKGFEVYYASEKGASLAKSILMGVSQDRVTETRYTKHANFTVLTRTNAIANLLECGYMSNPTDIAQLASQLHQKTLAKSIAFAVFKHTLANP